MILQLPRWGSEENKIVRSVLVYWCELAHLDTGASLHERKNETKVSKNHHGWRRDAEEQPSTAVQQNAETTAPEATGSRKPASAKGNKRRLGENNVAWNIA